MFQGETFECLVFGLDLAVNWLDFSWLELP